MYLSDLEMGYSDINKYNYSKFNKNAPNCVEKAIISNILQLLFFISFGLAAGGIKGG